jgi:hypothetical protein
LSSFPPIADCAFLSGCHTGALVARERNVEAVLRLVGDDARGAGPLE